MELENLTILNRTLETKIKEGEYYNSVAKDKRALRDRISETVAFLDNRLAVLTEMEKEINIILKNTKQARKQFIVDEVNWALSLVFAEGYYANLELEPYRNTYKATFRLKVNEKGKEVFMNPENQNGGLCRQVISLQVGLAIAELMGVHTVMMDEAANGGDKTTIRKLQPILQRYLAFHPDNTIVLNEHNGCLYEDSNARIFNLIKSGEGLSGYVKITEIIDQQGSNLNDLIL